MEFLAVSADIVTVLQAAAGAAGVPPGGKRRWPGRSPRAEVYLRFQRAALDVTSWLAMTRTLVAAEPQPATPAVVLALGAAASPDNHLLTAEARRVLGHVALLRFSLDHISGETYRIALLREFSRLQQATSSFLGALAEVRLVGRPGPQVVAERLTAVLAEAAAAIPEVPPARPFRLPRGRAHPRRWDEMDRAIRAIGVLQREFTIAARDDVGTGRRFWRIGQRERMHRWQVWRRAPWPGGWPGPEGGKLIDKYAPVNSGPGQRTHDSY